jgi:hypothetical protein
MGTKCFESLSNHVMLALLCAGMVVLSFVVIEGLFYVMETYLTSPPGDHFLKRVGWIH